MNTEQQQRIEQIRKRTVRWRQEAFHYGIDTAIDDIDFLLSIVKGQEAPSTLLSSEVAVKIALHIKGTNSGYYATREGLAELEAIISKHFANAALSDTATSMRSLCVEKVKAMRKEWRSEYDPAEPYEVAEAYYATAATEIIKELESLTLQEQEAKS